MLHKQNMHPYILLLYFITLLSWIVLYQHPICIIIYMLSLLGISIYLKVFTKQMMISGCIIIILVTFSNPLFVREGVDVLYQNNYLIITKQALLYGLFISLLLCNVLMLYQIMQIYIKSEHILYTFSNHFSVLGLLLMLIFRMLPKCKRKIMEIRDVQKTLHHQKKGLWYILKSLKEQFLILFTWIFETSLIMYESMKARGYRSSRTHYHIFRWRKIDTIYAIVTILINIVMYVGYRQFQSFYYYPRMAPLTFVGSELIIFVTILIFCSIPIFWKGERYA